MTSFNEEVNDDEDSYDVNKSDTFGFASDRFPPKIKLCDRLKWIFMNWLALLRLNL